MLKWWEKEEQKAIWILMTHNLETLKMLHKEFCPNKEVNLNDYEGYVKSNFARDLAKFLKEEKWKI